MPAFSAFYRPLGFRSGVQLISGAAEIGTGGVAAVATGTASVHVAVPFRKCKLVSLSVVALTAAAGSGAITATAFKRDNAGTPANRTLTAAFDLTATKITVADKAYTFPILSTATEAQQVFQTGDTLRVDVIAAGTVTTQPQVKVVAEWAVMS